MSLFTHPSTQTTVTARVDALPVNCITSDETIMQDVS